MASRIFAQATTRRVVAAGATLGAAGLVGSQLGGIGKTSAEHQAETPAEIQFNTSFGYIQNNKQLIKVPDGWTGRLFQIRNDYPKPESAQGLEAQQLPPMTGPDRPLPVLDPLHDAPWLNVDFRKDPFRYCDVIKEYCWEGNVNNEFVLQKNEIRKWYHAPWMHWNQNGREPLNGLTFERPTPPKELADTQTRQLQTWACGFYNEAGARVFGQMWENPNKPQWNKFQFPLGTCVFKILLTDATDNEVPTMEGSPIMKAVIAEKASQPSERDSKASELRLLQVDFAVRDDRAPIGWVFGTYMYNGKLEDKGEWNKIFPVGLMWGNDPTLWPKDVQDGKKPQESWINPAAEILRKRLNGTRPTWGFDGRMNGPADYFRSACASCHSTSSRDKNAGMTFDHDCFRLTDPAEREQCEAKITDQAKMKYFRNLKSGQAFEEGDVSGDYSLQLQQGYHNWKAWKNLKSGPLYRLKVKVPLIFNEAEEAKVTEAKREPLRAVGVALDQGEK